ncbi:hypothetical protein Q3O97_03240 [Ralstonia pseudosolanacearum]|uniref:hypothetical protein n=1 Tax=Ralstonia pseudosolanacearum TaxID=1310165 RepID=UPI0027021A39|nr:hypothetical protein [Ralstonia pseudosolanacearum]MDO3614859.1 hypothetical protein [Ralstonia pseudosolanacearum]
MSQHASSEVTPEEFARLVAELGRLLQAVPLPDQLWDAATIADWMGLSAETVAEAVVVRDGFPKPVQPTAARQGKRLWFADEVIQWARANRGRLPTGRGRRRQA